MSLKLITSPASEPVTLAEAKADLRVVGTDDDVLIGGLIVAAREDAEHITGRALMLQTWELALDEFKEVIELPKPPFSSITSVSYVDADGVTQTIASSGYQLDTHSEPARLLPSYGTSWPSTRDQANAVLIRFVAGYANAAAVPETVKSWMKLRIKAAYDKEEMSEYADRLLDGSKIWCL